MLVHGFEAAAAPLTNQQMFLKLSEKGLLQIAE